MNLCTKKIDNLIRECVKKTGVYISIEVTTSIMAHWKDNKIEKLHYLYLGNKIKLDDGTILEDALIKYNDSDALYNMLLRIKEEGVLL